VDISGGKEKMKRISRSVLLVFLFLTVFSMLSYAQGFGKLVGTVTDPSGAAVPSAQVKVVEVGTGLSRTIPSDAEGYYVISSLRPAHYNISIEARGFRTFDVKDVVLQADQTLTVNAKLDIGAANEVVEVSGQQLQVDTATSTLRQVIEQQRLTELPLNGRNAATLTLTSTGAVQGPSSGADQGTTKTFPGAVTLSVNGARQNQISYQLDGGNYVDEYTNVNQPFPNPDALQEFSVQTSNYSAEYGQNAGAVVNVVTRSGTNNFHGSAFEFVRNAVFNARKWDAPLTFNGQPTKDKGRDQLKRNQFGGTVGGPIIKDKTFFFGSYQGTRLRNLGSPTITTVPNATQRASATDPASIKVLKGIPVGDATNSVAFAKPDHQDFHQLLGKVDHVVTEKDRFSVRYAYDRFSKLAIFDPNNFLTYTDGSTITSQNTLLHESHVFSPHLLNDARFSYSREKASRGPAADAISAADLGVSLPFQPVKAIQAIRVNGGFTFGDNPSAAFVRNNFTWSDDVSWTLSKHDLHFGGTLERSRVDLDNKFFQPAEFSFSSIANFLAGKLSDPNSGTPAFRQGAGEFKNNRQIYAGLYIQDNIRVNRRLTVNAGLRWEPGRAQRELKNRWTQFRLADLIAGVHSTVFPNAPAGLFFPGDQGFPENGLRDSMNNFAPRLGFAWDVFGDSKTSLRGGTGIFFDTRQSGMNNNRMVDSTPFSPQLLLQTSTTAKPGTFSDPLCVQSGTSANSAAGCTSQLANYPFPALLPPPKNAKFRDGDLYVSWDPNHKWQVPTIYNWNLLIERQLPASFLVRAGYVGSHTSHLSETINQDPCLVSITAACTGALRRFNLIKPAADVTFGDVQLVPYDINSSYHSLQLTTERRAKALTLTASYTWSKSIDDLPPGQGLYGFDGTYSARPWDDLLRHAFDRGPSEFDHTHRFVSSFVYQLPMLAGTNGFVSNLLGGWQFSGLVSAQTGRPITLLSGSDNSHTGLGQDRPNIIGDAYGSGACAGVTIACREWLNPASFVANPAGTFGNVGKGSLRYPGFYQWDMGLGKNFKVTERVGLQFRAEFFNVFNRVNFSEDAVSGTGNFLKVSSKGNFGALKTAQDPRIGQLGLKLSF
jgi:outer membrane receptor protein involved in Fe transport